MELNNLDIIDALIYNSEKELKSQLANILKENQKLKIQSLEYEYQINCVRDALHLMEARMMQEKKEKLDIEAKYFKLFHINGMLEEDKMGKLVLEAENARDLSDTIARGHLEVIAGLVRDRKMWKRKVEKLEWALKRKAT